MSGPFESLDDLGLDTDDSLVCIDGVCAIPFPGDPEQTPSAAKTAPDLA